MSRKEKSRATINANPEIQAKFRQIFEQSFTTIDAFLNDVLNPVFGINAFERGYTDLLKAFPEVKTRAEESHIKSILHTGTFDVAGQHLKLFEIILDDHDNIRRASIQRVIRSFLDAYERAFMVFHYEHPIGRRNLKANNY